ncbi:MAG: hypothetical protein EBR82_46680 [Caulobacteraceae bacterium]|nr:hypothetical protein [Caulobacteraceae bacterium]
MAGTSLFAPKPYDYGWIKGITFPDPKAAGEAAQSAFGATGQFANALGGIGSSYMNALGQQGANYANAYGAYSGGLADLGRSGAQTFGYLGQGLGQLGNSYAGAYGGYAGGLGEVAKAMAQEQAGRYTSNAGAEAARQAALGNIGTAALGSYGQAANGAFGAWAANQQAYNQALQGLGTANQTGLAQLGSSRNAALGNLGSSYADLGGRLGAASALGNLNLGFDFGGVGGGDGFSATGPDGEIASGSYGGGSVGGGSGYATRTSDPSQLASMGEPAYAGLTGLQSNLMAGDISGSMNRNYSNAMQQLDAQHYSSRGMPSQMLGQTLSGLLTLGQDAYGNVNRGMREYYGAQADPRQRTDYSGILRQLGSGYRDAARNITGARGDLNAGYGTAMSQLPKYAEEMKTGYGTANSNIGSVTGALNSGFGSASGALTNLFDTSLGKLDLFKTPLDLAKEQRALDLYTQRAAANDRIAKMKSAPGNYDWQPYINNWQRRLDNMPMA